jgi:hypothetical protein
MTIECSAELATFIAIRYGHLPSPTPGKNELVNAWVDQIPDEVIRSVPLIALAYPQNNQQLSFRRKYIRILLKQPANHNVVREAVFNTLVKYHSNDTL